MATNYIKPKGENSYMAWTLTDFEEQLETLPPGIYRSWGKLSPVGTIFVFEPIEEPEKLINFTSGIVSEVVKETVDFFSPSKSEGYKELGLKQKMGMILYGPPGTGKTCAAFLAMKGIVKEMNAICIDMTAVGLNTALGAIKKLRAHQDNPVLIFCDEAEEWIAGSETTFLSFLDGNDSIDKCIFIGCTNYLQRIPARIRNRRSRIRRTFEVKSLPRAVYQEYLIQKLPSASKEVVEEFCFRAEENGLSIDEMKHAIIDYRVEGKPIKKAVVEVKNYNKQDKWDTETDLI